MLFRRIEDYSSDEFLSMYEHAKETGISRKEIADSLGISKHQLRRIITKVNKGIEIKDNPNVPKSNNDVGESPNEMLISSPSPMSVKELLDHFDIDEDDWIVTRITANTWDSYRKNDRRNLEWKDGQIINGTIEDTGDIFTKPLYQLKVFLVRKEPVAIRPVLRPIPIPIGLYQGSLPKRNKKYKTALVIPDIHFGFKRLRDGTLDPLHDRLALDIVRQVAHKLMPDEIIMLGDLFDFPEGSKFVTSPNFTQVMQPSVFEASWWLSQFTATTKKFTILEGNHDFRMNVQMANHISWAFDLRAVKDAKVEVYPVLSVPNLLGFDKVGINWIDGYPNNQYWLNNSLALEHGSKALAAPGATTSALVRERDYSTISGHIHRSETATRERKRKDDKELLQAVSAGFLGRLGGVLPGNTHTQMWNQGFATVRYNSDEQYIQNHLIDKGYCWFEGELFAAHDLTQAIETLGKSNNVGFF